MTMINKPLIDAVTFLIKELKPAGEMFETQAINVKAKEHNIAEHCLKQARRLLGIKAVRKLDDQGKCLYWALVMDAEGVDKGLKLIQELEEAEESYSKYLKNLQKHFTLTHNKGMFEVYYHKTRTYWEFTSFEEAVAFIKKKGWDKNGGGS